MIDQTLALILDAYRDLNSRRMFWIVLIISTLVAASFGAVGLTRTGFTVLGYAIPFFVNANTVTPQVFYKSLFLDLGINIWLTQLATCLALISTASIFPDFLAGGAVDLYVSRPISRLRLFLTKYFCGLLFVAMQIACFCTASFLVIGLRGGLWEPGIFWAVPIVVIFFSYLFCFCALVGVLTRSTVASVLLTILFWIVVYSTGATEVMLLGFQLHEERVVANLNENIDRNQQSLHDLDKNPTSQPASYRRFLENQTKTDQEQLSEYHGRFVMPHRLFYAVKTMLPKTSETVELLERVLVSRADLPRPPNRRRQSTSDFSASPIDLAAVQQEVRHRSVGWVVGTSLIFEAAVLAVAAFIFCRRDY